jgi:protein-S-isoprenylcysteine O-methyltransferase Ste14
MSLRNQLEKSGAWLFRHRSYLPLALIPLFLASLASFRYFGGSHILNELWQVFCLFVSLIGLALRILVVGHDPKGTSGRDTREQVASSLTTSGVYSLVRHPLYLGNYLVVAGFALWPHQWWLILSVSCVYALYYERIMLAEEAFLRQQFGEDFEKWAAKTPAFFPKCRGWIPSEVPFCFRTVAQREYNAAFLIVSVFFLFDLIGDSLVERRLQVDHLWFGILLVGFILFATLRSLKKRTRLLHAADR